MRTSFFVVASCAWPCSTLADEEQASEQNDSKNDSEQKKDEKKDKEKKDDEDKELKLSCAYGDETTVKSRASTGCSAVGLRFAFSSLDVPKTGLYAGAMF